MVCFGVVMDWFGFFAPFFLWVLILWTRTFSCFFRHDMEAVFATRTWPLNFIMCPLQITLLYHPFSFSFPVSLCEPWVSKYSCGSWRCWWKCRVLARGQTEGVGSGHSITDRHADKDWMQLLTFLFKRRKTLFKTLSFHP